MLRIENDIFVIFVWNTLHTFIYSNTPIYQISFGVYIRITKSLLILTTKRNRFDENKCFTRNSGHTLYMQSQLISSITPTDTKFVRHQSVRLRVSSVTLIYMHFHLSTAVKTQSKHTHTRRTCIYISTTVLCGKLHTEHTTHMVETIYAVQRMDMGIEWHVVWHVGRLVCASDTPINRMIECMCEMMCWTDWSVLFPCSFHY